LEATLLLCHILLQRIKGHRSTKLHVIDHALFTLAQGWEAKGDDLELLKSSLPSFEVI